MCLTGGFSQTGTVVGQFFCLYITDFDFPVLVLLHGCSGFVKRSVLPAQVLQTETICCNQSLSFLPNTCWLPGSCRNPANMMQRRFAAQTFMVSQQFLFLFCKLQQVQPRSDLVLCLPTLICKSDLYLSESSGEKPLQHTDHLANCTNVCKITSPRDDKRIRPSVFVSVGGLLISRGTNFRSVVQRVEGEKLQKLLSASSVGFLGEQGGRRQQQCTDRPHWRSGN